MGHRKHTKLYVVTFSERVIRRFTVQVRSISPRGAKTRAYALVHGRLDTAWTDEYEREGEVYEGTGPSRVYSVEEA